MTYSCVKQGFKCVNWRIRNTYGNGNKEGSGTFKGSDDDELTSHFRIKVSRNGASVIKAGFLKY